MPYLTRNTPGTSHHISTFLRVIDIYSEVISYRTSLELREYITDRGQHLTGRLFTLVKPRAAANIFPAHVPFSWPMMCRLEEGSLPPAYTRQGHTRWLGSSVIIGPLHFVTEVMRFSSNNSKACCRDLAWTAQEWRFYLLPGATKKKQTFFWKVS